MIPKVRILDIPFSIMGLDETVRYCESLMRSQVPHHVITANPEIVMMAQENQRLRNIIEAADLVTCDGTGIVWASQFFSDFPAKERVTGFDLTLRLLTLCEKEGFSVYFLGTTPAIIDAAVAKIRQEWPALTIKGYHHGYFRGDDENNVLADIRDKKPNILFVALGAPKQEYWISDHLPTLPVNMAMGVGGTFDVLSGTMKRAPVVWQRLRLEWLYRLVQQPSRWRRMLVLPKFVMNVLKSKKKDEISDKK